MYLVFLFRLNVGFVSAVNSCDFFVKNMLEAAACIGSKVEYLGDAAEESERMRSQSAVG